MKISKIWGRLFSKTKERNSFNIIKLEQKYRLRVLSWVTRTQVSHHQKLSNWQKLKLNTETEHCWTDQKGWKIGERSTKKTEEREDKLSEESETEFGAIRRTKYEVRTQHNNHSRSRTKFYALTQLTSCLHQGIFFMKLFMGFPLWESLPVAIKSNSSLFFTSQARDAGATKRFKLNGTRDPLLEVFHANKSTELM